MSRLDNVARRVNERYLTAPVTDPVVANDMHRLKQLVTATESAMDAEGIPLEVRDRIIYRLLYGDAPYAYEEPDWAGAPRREAERVARIKAILTAGSVSGIHKWEDK